MTADDLARIRHAIQLRDRCVQAAVTNGERLDLPVTTVQARVAYDAMAPLLVTEHARRLGVEADRVDALGGDYNRAVAVGLRAAQRMLQPGGGAG
jgi:ParB-like chromosome segregation protein Spo0J